MQKIAVYTFAKGCQPRTFAAEEGVDYFALTDGEAPAPWTKKEIEYSGCAYDANKFYKWHPHLLFKDYDYAVYIDATIAIKDVAGFVKSIGAGSTSGINLAMHREHNTPDVELSRCRQFKKVDFVGDICASEYVRVHHSKYPVPETTVIIYDMKRLSVAALDEIWRQYQICAAHRDQLAVNYAFEKTGFHPLRQQTLPGYIPMGRFTYGIPYINYADINEKKKDARTVPLLSATMIAVPGNPKHPVCNAKYLALLPKPKLGLTGRQMLEYKLNEHHVFPSEVQKWLPRIFEAMGLKYDAPKTSPRHLQFGPYYDTVEVPVEGRYALYEDGKKVKEGGAEILTQSLHPLDAYHDMWWSRHLPTMTVRDGEGPDVLLIANSMVIPLLPLMAAVCRRLVYVDNRHRRNIDWIRPEEYERAIIFDPKDNGQEHTALEAIRILAMR